MSPQTVQADARDPTRANAEEIEMHDCRRKAGRLIRRAGSPHRVRRNHSGHRVTLIIAGIREGRDELLEVALRQIFGSEVLTEEIRKGIVVGQ